MSEESDDVPMTIDEIERLHEEARRVGAGDREREALVDALLSRHDREAIGYHFELLRDRTDEALYQALRDCFERHGKPAEGVLREVFLRERSSRARADALFVLGRMRSKHARPLAVEAVGAEDEELRRMGGVVLGWVGAEGPLAACCPRGSCGVRSPARYGP